jgi:hypothetical protein
MKADLHIHTTASDGRLSPAQIVHRAAQLGLSVIAITDHDSVEGIEPALVAARAYPNLLVTPGVELNTDVPQGEIHILGYFIDYQDQSLGERLKGLRCSREERGRKMVAKLAQVGIHIDWERVLELAAGASVGRPHIAQAMLEQGYVPSLQEAFDRYIGRDGPAYVEREGLTPVEAVALVVGAEGLPVLAHPAGIGGLDSLIHELKQAGLVGLEVYYNGYTQVVISRLRDLARRHNLIPCGGSDYHGIKAEDALGNVDVPPESVAQLVSLARQRRAIS